MTPHVTALSKSWDTAKQRLLASYREIESISSLARNLNSFLQRIRRYYRNWEWAMTTDIAPPTPDETAKLCEELADAAYIEPASPDTDDGSSDADDANVVETEIVPTNRAKRTSSSSWRVNAVTSSPVRLAGAMFGVQQGDHTECYGLGGRQFWNWLTALFYAIFNRIPSEQAKRDATGLLCRIARDATRHVSARVGHLNGKIYIDLGTADWSVIEIDEAGWRIITKSPVLFRRPQAHRYLQPVCQYQPRKTHALPEHCTRAPGAGVGLAGPSTGSIRTISDLRSPQRTRNGKINNTPRLETTAGPKQ